MTWPAAAGSARAVHAVRHLLARRRLAVAICVATLLLKLLVPAGYMIGRDHGSVSIAICSGTGPVTMTMASPASGMHGDRADHGRSRDHGKADMPCAFAGLAAAALGAIDPVRVAMPIGVVAVLGPVAALLPAPARPAYLRPPLRGPPARR